MENSVLRSQESKVSEVSIRSSFNELDDVHHLLHKIAESDEQKAFSKFFRLYHGKMLLLARIFVSTPHAAEDVVSEVMIKLLRNRRETFRKKNFLGFLYTCIKNQAIDHIRKNRKYKHLKLDNENIDYFIQHRSNPCNQMMGKEFDEIITACIENLPPRRKLIYKLIKDDKLSYKQVGKLLDISVRTVEVQLRLAVRHVKLVVDDYLACKRLQK